MVQQKTTEVAGEQFEIVVADGALASSINTT